MFVPYNPDGSIVMYPADLRNVALGKGRTAALADPTNKHTIENLSLTLSNSLQLKLHKDLTFDASYNINNYRRLYKDRTAANIYSDAVGVTKTPTTTSTPTSPTNTAGTRSTTSRRSRV